MNWLTNTVTLTRVCVCVFLCGRGFAGLYLGLHASDPHPGLGPVGDGLLVPGVEDVDQLGVVGPGGAVVQTWGPSATHHSQNGTPPPPPPNHLL